MISYISYLSSTGDGDNDNDDDNGDDVRSDDNHRSVVQLR